MQIYLSQEIRKREMEKRAKLCQLTGFPGGPTGPVSPGIPGWPYHMHINTDLELLPTQTHTKSRKNVTYEISNKNIFSFKFYAVNPQGWVLFYVINWFTIRHKHFCSNALEHLEKTEREPRGDDFISENTLLLAAFPSVLGARQFWPAH